MSKNKKAFPKKREKKLYDPREKEALEQAQLAWWSLYHCKDVVRTFNYDKGWEEEEQLFLSN